MASDMPPPTMTPPTPDPATAASEATSQSPASAAQRVFEIPELLEDILLQILRGNTPHESKHTQTVLLGQRVNHTVNATVNGSERILQALWMIPNNCSSDSLFGTKDGDMNPLIKAKADVPPFSPYSTYFEVGGTGFELGNVGHQLHFALDVFEAQERELETHGGSGTNGRKARDGL